jgi:hypothetical protein
MLAVIGRARSSVFLAAIAAQCACARPIIVEVYDGPRRSRQEIALVVAWNGSGRERVDITDVDERGIAKAFTSTPVWIEVPPGRHLFEVELAWTRSGGASMGVPLTAEVQVGRCYRPVLGRFEVPDNWLTREPQLEAIGCPFTWTSFPREIRKADQPAIGL